MKLPTELFVGMSMQALITSLLMAQGMIEVSAGQQLIAGLLMGIVAVGAGIYNLRK